MKNEKNVATEPITETLERERLALIGRAGQHYVYANRPYSCGFAECVAHLSGMVPACAPTITRRADSTEIVLAPRQGTGARKPYIITLWIAK